jgi:hypothetical protein
MRKLTVVLASATLALTLAACGANPGTDNPLPQDTSTSAPDKTTEAPDEETPKATTCDKAREALLTGSPKQIKAAMKALVKDKKADATAREAAQDWLDTTDKDLRKMHADLVQMACSI